MSLPYEQMIPRAERENLESVLEMESGYVLDFTDRAFNDFFFETVDINPDEKSYLFAGRGTSKAKRFRAFIEHSNSPMVAKVLRGLWEYRESLARRPTTQNENKMQELFFDTVARIEGCSDAIDTTAIESFELSETLEELVSSI